MKGIIIENSLEDKSIITEAEIIRTDSEGDWIIRHVQIAKEWAEKLGKHLKDGPWYAHFWESGSDDVLVVFKDKNFWIKYSDKATWQDVIKYGKSLGIPEDQLDFLID